MDYSLLIGVRRKRFEVVDRDRPADQGTIISLNKDSIIRYICTARTSDPEADEHPANDNSNPYKQDNDGGIHAGVVEGAGAYYFGIIDTLQEWNWRKQIEQFFKIYVR